LMLIKITCDTSLWQAICSMAICCASTSDPRQAQLTAKEARNTVQLSEGNLKAIWDRG
jgi:hypothetical protein